jgi:hypothetical protein
MLTNQQIQHIIDDYLTPIDDEENAQLLRYTRSIEAALLKTLAAGVSVEPVAWGYRGKDGVIRDCIGPDSHVDYEGDYKIPLYPASGAAPKGEQA